MSHSLQVLPKRHGSTKEFRCPFQMFPNLSISISRGRINPREESSRLTASTEENNAGATYGSVSNHISEASAPEPYNESDLNTEISAESSDHEEEEDPMIPGTDSEEIDDALTALTRRLRCLFSVVTWPIVPLGSLCILGLVWLLYASFVLDIKKSCSHPLHWYSIASLIFLVYMPFHTSIRSFLFHYDRDRDGPNRPASVRRYDQCFNTIALLYVYAGITFVQACRDDLVLPDGTNPADTPSLDMSTLKNSCAATCPSTFESLRVYVTCLELFVLSLIVPLLFLPCLYLYFVRRTMQDGEALAILQDRLREEEALRRNGGITAEEILGFFEIVQLMVDPRTIDRKIIVVPRPQVDKDTTETKTPVDFSQAKECDMKECCICMKNFHVLEVNDIETGEADEDSSDDRVVRTSQTCGHLFHERCIASWVGGRWEANSNAECRPARHTTCPLCRRDFRPNR